MVDYKGLEPGLYIQQGDSLKSLNVLQSILGAQNSPTPTSAADLAAKVAWVFIALEIRREHIGQIPVSWRTGAEELDSAPFGMNDREVFKRIDEAIQLFGRAYLLKVKNGFGKVLYLRWLDPSSIRVDDKDIGPDGVTQYIRQTREGQEIAIPAEDLLVFTDWGMGEVFPRTSAVDASTLAAQVLYGMGKTSDTHFDNNGLPVMLIRVTAGTNEKEVTRLQDRFNAIFNRGKGTDSIRTVGVKNGVEVVPLSLAPKDLAMSDLSKDQIAQVLGAHRVPRSMAMGEEVNRSVAEVGMRSLIATLGGRLRDLAAVFNADPDIAKSGITLEILDQDHWSMKTDERESAEAFKAYLHGFTPEAAAYLLGIKADDFPEDIGEVFREDAKLEDSIGDDTNSPANGSNNANMMQEDETGPNGRSKFGPNGQNNSKYMPHDVAHDTHDSTYMGHDTNNAKNDTHDTHDAAMMADLFKWRKKCLKAYRRGDSPVQPFKSEYIDPVLAAAITGGLEACETDQDIKATFRFEAELL